MGKEKIKDIYKLNEYKQRHKEWRDISVTQLSNVNNIFITLSTGLLAFIIKNRTEDIYFVFCGCIDWSDASFVIAVILMCISIICGIGVLFSRLYDFRISRHLALTRQRFYDKQIKVFKDKDYEEHKKKEKYTFCDRLDALKKINRINISQEDETDMRKKFNELKERSYILGEATWIWTRRQVCFFLLSALIYFITQLIKF